MPARALVLSTLDTKRRETEFLIARLAARGIDAETADLSLGSGGQVWDGDRKRAEMRQVAEGAARELALRIDPERHIAVGLGGGTGSEIVLRVFRRMPLALPKMLITPLPFDPRIPLADNPVVLVPTPVDVCGLNDRLRQALDRAAALASGMSPSDPPERTGRRTVAVSSLGATGAATELLLEGLRERGVEAEVFHANGFGGAGLARALGEDPPAALVDLTPHELTRMLVAGPHAPMPERFRAAGRAGVPQVVLPGGLNFLGFDGVETVPGECRERRQYRHSGFFTHVEVSGDEMARIAASLADRLNESTGTTSLIVPMGGFSHQDRPGGAICNPALRQAFLDTVRRGLAQRVELTVTDAHISDPEVAGLVLERLAPVLDDEEEK